MDTLTIKILIFLELFLVLIAITLGIFGAIAFYDIKYNTKEDQTMDELTAKSIIVDGKGVFGNYTGLNYKLITAFTATLELNTVNSVSYNAGNTTTLTLPTASYGSRCVIVFAEDVVGPNQLIIKCPTNNNFDSESYIPTTNSGVLIYSKIENSKSTLTYAPANTETNLLSIGSSIEFISIKDNIWQIGNVYIQSGNNISSTVPVTGTFTAS